jgi:hypothetical protein
MLAHRPLEIDEAAAVLQPYYEALQQRYVTAGLRRVGKTRLSIEKRAHDGGRHFAMCRDDGAVIVAAPELADQAEDIVIGILAHELGHAADYSYPCRYQLADGALIEWEHPDWVERARKEEGDARALFNRSRQWERRVDDEIELTADAIATRIMARPIRYAGPCMLQSFRRGSAPRPVGLR